MKKDLLKNLCPACALLDWFPAGMKAAGQPSGEQRCFLSGDEGLALKRPHPDSIPLWYQDCDLPNGQPSAGI